MITPIAIEHPWVKVGIVAGPAEALLSLVGDWGFNTERQFRHPAPMAVLACWPVSLSLMGRFSSKLIPRGDENHVVFIFKCELF